MYFALFVIMIIAIYSLTRATYFEERCKLLQHDLAEHDQRALDAAHEIEDCIGGPNGHPDTCMIDPVLNAYCVGRVSRPQLHEAITDWLTKGKDFRDENNRFWL